MILFPEDKEILNKIAQVDWTKVTPLQSQSLGISLGIFDDVGREAKISSDVYRNHLIMGVIVSAVMIVATLLGASQIAIVVGVIVMLTCNIIISKIQCNVNRTLIENERQAIINEIESIVVDQNGSIEVPIDD